MKPDELRLILGDRAKIQQDPFSVARMIADICNVDPDAPLAREMVIRALDHADLFEPLDGLLDALARQVGLFPYAAPERLGLRDQLAWEAHRPLDLQLDGKDIVFHREQADVYRGLMDGQSFVLSAPTSFGKSLVIDALIASGRYWNTLTQFRLPHRTGPACPPRHLGRTVFPPGRQHRADQAAPVRRGDGPDRRRQGRTVC